MRIHRHSAVAVVLLLTMAASARAADTFTVDPVHSNVGFAIPHLVSKVRGRFNDFEGTSLDRKDSGVTWNGTLEGVGLLLGDEVEVTVAIEAVRER